MEDMTYRELRQILNMQTLESELDLPVLVDSLVNKGFYLKISDAYRLKETGQLILTDNNDWKEGNE
jgi:hypothetical protein